MNAQVLKAVASRLSLRRPQTEALTRLAKAIDLAPQLVAHERVLSDILATLKEEFETLKDFEREFPSLCFALATGVGKTRLMGAFVAYLHLAHGINNFLVLAPNLTIYDKLITDFTPNTAKYVFRGIAEFAQQPPLIITGENYDSNGAAVGRHAGFAHDLRINIFNISKINSEVRGGREPRIKRMKEVLGDSYFNHLASLPDLVLLMDESHRYRASAGVRAINELRPLLGLELTATPFTESARGHMPFSNVIMDYPLARALEDGYVKEPAVVTQQNFVPQDHSDDEIERVKLQDGARVHELTKAELLTFAKEYGERVVKPLMLVIARDTTHARELAKYIASEDFFNGRYQGKVIQVDSSRSGAEEEEMVRRLLAVEAVNEPTEIVVHVNMLKEGWDVSNLYTIVPLRAANARTLIEQSIGRGLRLPYGRRTGVEAVDRLNIVAHDKFQEIVDEANRGDSPIRLKRLVLDAPMQDEKAISLQVSPGLIAYLGLVDKAAEAGATVLELTPEAAQPPVGKAEQLVVQTVMDVIGTYESKSDAAPTTAALMKPEIQQEILIEVEKRLKFQGKLFPDLPDHALSLSSVVAKTTEIVVDRTIDIPRIALIPRNGKGAVFRPFDVNFDKMDFVPGNEEILVHNLRTNEEHVLSSELLKSDRRLEDYVVTAMLAYDDIDYFTQAELLYDLSSQVVQHLRAYLPDDDVRRVLAQYRTVIARQLHEQMLANFVDDSNEFDIHISRGFTALKPCTYTVISGQSVRNFRETVSDKMRIRTMLFGGFSRCLYPIQKFDSDTERRFAVILERDASKWFKPAKGQFQIDYRLDGQHAEYVPDFVAELDSLILMIETKAQSDLKSDEVRAKAAAAWRWCSFASQHSLDSHAKPWKYLLIPDNKILESRTLSDYLQYEMTSGM